MTNTDPTSSVMTFGHNARTVLISTCFKFVKRSFSSYSYIFLLVKYEF